jgi:putative transposase
MRYGYPIVDAHSKREGFYSMDMLYRVYREGLTFAGDAATTQASVPSNQVWSLDFAADQLSKGPVPLLTIVDVFARECLAIEVGQGLSERAWWQHSANSSARTATWALFCDNG